MERVRQRDENFYTLNKSIPELESCVQKNVTSGIIKLIEKIAEEQQWEDPDEVAADIIFDCFALQEIKEDLTSVLTSCIKDYIGVKYDINT